MAVKERLTTRGIQIDTTCSNCSRESESICHMLFVCEKAKEVWDLANIPLPQNGFSRNSVFLNFLHLLKIYNSNEGDPNTRSVFPWLVWEVWKARNALAFDNKTVSAYTIASRAFEEASSWQKTMILKTNTEIVDVVVRTEENIGWIKPPSGCLKCNVGSSWVDPHHPSGASWILRGEDGQTIMHSRRSYSFMRSKAEADLWAMLWAVECMHNTHQVNVIFEASSEQLHNVLCEPLHHLEFTGVVQSINQLLNGINGWSLDHALQERNEAAAAIAVSVTRDRRYQSYMAQHEPAWLHQLLSLEASSN